MRIKWNNTKLFMKYKKDRNSVSYRLYHLR